MKFYSAITSLVVFLLSTAVDAQKDGKESRGIGIFEAKQDYIEFMKTLKKEASGNPELKQMIPMINDVALGKPIGTTSKGKGIASGLDLLASKKIREELEIVDDQYEGLLRMRSEVQQRAARELRQLDFSDRENFSVRLRAIKDNTEKELDELLLPHQSKRLRQLETQVRLRKESLARMLTRDPVKAQLEISDEQAKSLVQAEKEIELELEKEFTRLRAEAREKLLSKLNRSQRDQVDRILGDSFDFSDEKKAKEKKVKPKKKLVPSPRDSPDPNR